MLSEKTQDLERYTNQMRFIQMIIDGQLVIAKKKKADLVVELRIKHFKPIGKTVDASKQGELEPIADNEDENEEVEAGASSYDYLLGVSLNTIPAQKPS